MVLGEEPQRPTRTASQWNEHLDDACEGLGSGSEGAFTHVTAGSMVACFIHTNGCGVSRLIARWVMVRRSTVWVCIGCTCHLVVRRWDWMPDTVTSAPSSMTEAWRVGVRMPKARSATTARPMRSPLRSSYHRARRSSGSVWPRPIPVHGTPPARHGAGAGTTTVSSGTGTPIVRNNSRPPRCSHIRAPRASAPLGASSTCQPVPSRCVPCTPMAWSPAGGCEPTIPLAMAYLGTPMDMIGSVHRAPRSSVIMVGWSQAPAWILPEETSLNRTLRPVGWGLTVQSIANLPASMVFDRASAALKYDGTSTPHGPSPCVCRDPMARCSCPSMS